MSSTFKLGDRVRIRSWESMEKEFGFNEEGDIKCALTFTTPMKLLCGRTGTITKKETSRSGKVHYTIDYDDSKLPDQEIITKMLFTLSAISGDMLEPGPRKPFWKTWCISTDTLIRICLIAFLIQIIVHIVLQLYVTL